MSGRKSGTYACAVELCVEVESPALVYVAPLGTAVSLFAAAITGGLVLVPVAADGGCVPSALLLPASGAVDWIDVDFCLLAECAAAAGLTSRAPTAPSSSLSSCCTLYLESDGAAAGGAPELVPLVAALIA